MRRVVIGLLLLLCQCSTKHQPVLYPPYFATAPEGYSTPKLLDEIEELEKTGAGSPWQMRRLYDLYAIEISTLKPGSPRYEQISTNLEKLRPAVTNDLEHLTRLTLETLATRRKNSQKDKPTSPLGETWREPYQQAYALWNSDQNREAVEKIKVVESSPNYEDTAADDEKYKFHTLKFRVLTDLGELDAAHAPYEKMKWLDECATDTSQAGLLLSMLYFGRGDAKRAKQIFDDQCDEDESQGNLLRRRYWSARFQEAISGDKTGYQQIISSELPGYYTYLSAARVGKKLELSTARAEALKFLALQFSVPRRVHDRLLLAEDRLEKGLRRDARVYLDTASEAMGNEADSGEGRIPWLYIASLYHAAGDHLGAMRAYAVVTKGLSKSDPIEASFASMDVFRRMYPRPFTEEVEWQAKQWDVDSDLIYSIMRQESAFDPGAVSRTSARGLMQIMPNLARSIAEKWGAGGLFSEKLLFRASENVRVAAIHLRNLKGWGKHPALVAGGYNAGTKRVLGWWTRHGHLPLDIFVELVPVAETRDYIKLVLRNLVCYRLLRNDGTLETNLFPLELPPPPVVSALPKTL